jgi:hypothetical protein
MAPTAQRVPGGLNMNKSLLPSLAVAGFVLGTGIEVAAQTAAAPEERVTRHASGHVSDHAADELRDPTTFKLQRRELDKIAVRPRAAPGKETQSVQAAGDSWIYDATTDLFTDRDRDGYFSFLRVQLDADTIFTRRWVYVEIYLSADGTAWEHLYSTQDFLIEGTDPDDDYEVETELVSGYSTGQYDVLIELYDADTNELVDEYGPIESVEFSLLPLEDSGRDGAVIVLPPEDDGGGGAFSWLGVLGLLGALGLRRRLAR